MQTEPTTVPDPNPYQPPASDERGPARSAPRWLRPLGWALVATLLIGPVIDTYGMIQSFQRITEGGEIETPEAMQGRVELALNVTMTTIPLALLGGAALLAARLSTRRR